MLDALISWLRRHSTSVKEEGGELKFIHANNRSSILAVRADWLDDTIRIENRALADFYSAYWAASIGNGYIIIGTPIQGGLEVSHGFRVPDLQHIREKSESLGMHDAKSMEAFMIEASWMFLYGIDQNTNHLVRFDRDFGSCEVISSIENVLDEWWQIVADEQIMPE